MVAHKINKLRDRLIVFRRRRRPLRSLTVAAR
jgi:hypothetical protein